MRTLFAVSPISSTGNAYNRYNHRFVIAASALQGTASSVRVKFRRTTFDYTLHASIGLQATSGDVYDIDPATLIQFQQIVGTTELHITAEDQYSNTVELAIDGTRNVVIAIYRDTSGSVGAYFNTETPKPAGLSIYGRSVTSDESGYANVASYTANISVAYCFEALEGESEPVSVRSLLDQPWSIKTGAELIQPWGDAPVSRSLLYQPWADAAVIRSLLKQPWSDALAARSLLVQPWSIAADARALLVQPWAITAEGVRAVLDQPWAIEDFEPVRSLLDQPWAIATDDSVCRYAVSCTVGGLVVRPLLITIEGDLDEDSLLCELQLATEEEYARCRDGLELGVTITSNEATEYFLFVITSARINEEHGNTQYVVEAMSATALFGPPYSEGQNGELTGMTSTIASGLVGSVVWQTVDWEIDSGVWSAAGETSLELLRKLTASVRAVVQSDPDGSIRVQAEYRIPVNQWAIAIPDRILVENLDCFSVGSTFDPRSGRNRFLVGGQAVSGDRASLELADISTGLKQARAYQVPWRGDLILTHTGGAWASITAMGIEDRLVSETVEIVSGSGQTQYPVYGEPVVSWLQNNLGTVTASEGGVITAQIAGESLAAITYRTRCMLWQVRDAKPEQLQLVVKQ